MKMIRRFTLTVLLAVACCGSLSAQYFEQKRGLSLRPFAGINMSKVMVGVQNVSKHQFGLTAGVEAEYRLNYLLGVSVAAAFSAEGGKMNKPIDYGILARKGDQERWNYLLVPVVGRVYLAEWLALEGGVEPCFLLSAEEGGYDVKEKLRSVKWQVPIGIQAEYRNVTLNLRYHYCPGDVLSDKTDFGVGRTTYKLQDFNAQVFSLTAGYRFKL